MARRKPAQVHGLAVVDKPAGCTSHDVVDRLRRRLGERKIGHAGTLDPDATGVLVLGVGDATRLMRFMDLVVEDGVSSSRKSYTGDVVLGAETTTLDGAGEVTATHDMREVLERIARPDGREFVQQVVNANLLGDIMQVPPMVSAIRVDGQRLHELAREGIEIEREARPVTVYRCEVTKIDVVTSGGGLISLDVECSSGTFIRSIAADLGHLLGGGAHLTNLRRTSVGAFTLSDAGTIDEATLHPVATAVRGLTRCEFSGDEAREISEGLMTGRVIEAHRLGSFGPAPWAVFVDDGRESRLGAVFEPFENPKVGQGMARPAVNLWGNSPG